MSAIFISVNAQVQSGAFFLYFYWQSDITSQLLQKHKLTATSCWTRIHTHIPKLNENKSHITRLAMATLVIETTDIYQEFPKWKYLSTIPDQK